MKSNPLHDFPCGIRIVPGFFLLLLFFLCGLASPLAAQDSGDFIYTSNGSAITITGCGIVNGSVSIPSQIDGLPVRAIGDNAFGSHFHLTSVTIPEGVTSIGDYAFEYCSNLASVTIPDSVTSIGDGAFYICYSLTSVTIPAGVTRIGDYTFENCSKLTSVTIPDSVTSIGDVAFYNCSKLTIVIIPGSVTSIGREAFERCSHMTSVTIPDSVTSIGDKAFQSCTSLASVTIPASVTSIGDYAFGNCNSLQSIAVDEANPAYRSVDGVLFNKNGTALLAYPTAKTGNYAIPTSVTSIRNDAFHLCQSLTSVTIPDSVTGIGDFAFAACTSLTNVTIPDSVTSIGADVFGDCTSLTSVTISGSVTSIGDKAFYGCSSLTSVTIPGSVKSIEDQAFYACTSLTSVIFLGNAPALGVGGVINGDVSGLTAYFTSGATGFTTPTWQGYPAVALRALEIWRLAYFGSVDSTGAAADDADPDGDGRSNTAEFAAGTDPTDPADALRVVSSVLNAGAYTVQISGKVGRTYALERGNDLGSDSWTVVSGAVAGPLASDGPVTLIDAAAIPGQGFYRVSVSTP